MVKTKVKVSKKEYKKIIGKKIIIKAFKFLISQKNIKLGKVIKKAVEFFESTKLDMADCLIAAHSPKGKLVSFDKKLLSVKEVKKYF